jgi:ribosome biogenesis protein Tsr3
VLELAHELARHAPDLAAEGVAEQRTDGGEENEPRELRAEKDADSGLLLVDATWRYAAKMCEAIDKVMPLPKRVLPGRFRTAYPRAQTECPNPLEGLASIEALYLAFMITGRPVDGLLDHYYWKEAFLELNGLP